MSLLAAYYDAVNAEKYASADSLSATARNTQAQTNEVAADHASQRGLQGAQAGEAGQRGKLAGAQAGQVAANDAATRGLQAAQGGLYGANANLTNVQAGLAPATAQSEAGLRAAQGGYYTSQSGSNQGNIGQADPNPPPENDQSTGEDPTAAPSGGDGGSGGGGGSDPTDNKDGLAKGGKVMSKASVIQGKAPKPGPTDTVPAMLTPGEAVLNKGAAEHYGSDVIDHMNKMGLMRMAAQSEVAAHLGLPDPHAKPVQSTANKKGAKGRLVVGGAAPTGNAPPVPISPQPAGGAARPTMGAMPGFWQGTSSVPMGYGPDHSQGHGSATAKLPGF